jgi:WD40 repeat protein
VSYFGQVFQYQSTGQLTKLNSGASQSFDAVAWSSDGSYALIAGDGGGILKYNGTTFQALNTAGLYSSTLTVRFISFSPTGNFALLVGDSGLVLAYNGSSLSALPTLTSNALYSVSWAAGTAYIVGGAGTMLTYSGGTLKNVPTGTFSGFRGIAWKPN